MTSLRQISVVGFCMLAVSMAWIIYWADTGAESPVFTWVEKIPWGDKFAHLCLYGGLALLLNLSLDCRCFQVVNWPIQWGSFLVLFVATLEEITQGFFATRTLDSGDLLADLLGVYLAACLLRPQHPVPDQ